MRDLQNLKQRIAHADRHFKEAEEARSRESESLAETWDGLKQRFDAQQRELARYRARLDVLVDANDELAAMIDRLIETIESSARKAEDETVPRLTRLARELLTEEPDADEMARLKADSADRLVAGETEVDALPPDPRVIPDRGVGALLDHVSRRSEPGAEEKSADKLTDELRDIETLRRELHGLRDRITGEEHH